MTINQSRGNTIEWWLHIFAALLLLLFAASHFAFDALELADSFPNPVFPFLNNKMVYLVAGVLEAAAGLVCLKFRGRTIANILLLSFVGAILWYRWAFHFSGGQECNCLGVLGRLLRVSKSQEKIISVAALCIFVLSTSPWILRSIRKSERNVLLCVLLGGCLFTPWSMRAQGGFQITGEFDSAYLNAATGNTIPGTEKRCSFAVLWSTNQFRINVTNLYSITNSANRNQWEEVSYDSTNTYIRTFYLGRVDKPAPESNAVYASISPFPLYLPSTWNAVDMFVPWIAFGVSPKVVAARKSGEVPLPWLELRVDPQAFGYQWAVKPSPSGDFAEDIRIVRNKRLDLDEKQELFRPELNYPETLEAHTWRLKRLNLRRSVPDGFLAAHYACTNWLWTNGVALPLNSQFERYNYHSKYTNSPTFRAQIRLKSVTALAIDESVLPAPMANTYVDDYRFRQTNETHLFQAGRYWLKPGATWKVTNDVALLAQVSDWFAHGHRYDEFPVRRNKNILAWLLFVGMFIPPLIMAVLKKTKQNNKSPTIQIL